MGWDLLDWFRGRRPWNQLLRLVGQLPKYSRYWVARAEDDELAEALLRRPQAPSGAPSLAAWGPYDELVAAIREEFASTRYVIAATTPGVKPKPKVPQPLPRPSGALQRAERRAERRTYDFIVSQVLPRG